MSGLEIGLSGLNTLLDVVDRGVHTQTGKKFNGILKSKTNLSTNELPKEILIELKAEVIRELQQPRPDRIRYIADAFRLGLVSKK